jgi:hypothetical protein
MTAAIFGLLGVIVGGVLNGVVTWRIERFRERQDAKAAARLAHVELGNARSGFDAYAFRPGPDTMAQLQEFLTDDVWREHRPLLARVLDPPEWLAVSAAYQQVAFFRLPATRDLSEIKSLLDGPEGGRLAMGAMGYRDNMNAAMSVLAEYSGDRRRRRSLIPRQLAQFR